MLSAQRPYGPPAGWQQRRAHLPPPHTQEDILEEPAPRMFWPREIWGRYAKSLDAFKDPANRGDAVRCLNHMVGGGGVWRQGGYRVVEQLQAPSHWAHESAQQIRTTHTHRSATLCATCPCALST